MLEEKAIKLCENLPLNLTFFEKEGFCKNSNETCRYVAKINEGYLCNKKTYSINLSLAQGNA